MSVGCDNIGDDRSNVTVSADLEGSVQDCGCVVFAVPSSAFRQIARQISGYLKKGTTVLVQLKGLRALLSFYQAKSYGKSFLNVRLALSVDPI